MDEHLFLTVRRKGTLCGTENSNLLVSVLFFCHLVPAESGRIGSLAIFVLFCLSYKNFCGPHFAEKNNAFWKQ